MAKQERKTRKKRTALILLSVACLVIAAGYHTGRATSTNWNSKETAFLYACRASYRPKNAPDGAVLALRLPDALIRWDGNDAKEIPLAAVVEREPYPVVGADEYDAWLNAVLAFGAGAGAKTAWDVITDASELKGFERVIAEERVLLSVVTIGSFGGGYLLGHRSESSFHGPIFRDALRDKNVWKRIQSCKDQHAEGKRNLDNARKDLKAIHGPADAPDRQTIESEKRISQLYADLLKLDPDLKN
jgi:hypothetical protein